MTSPEIRPTASPCGGCPPCCSKCVFASTGVETHPGVNKIVQFASDYGCVLPRAGDIVRTPEGVLGQMRGAMFYRVTAEGAVFLRECKNPLASAL